LSTHLRLCLPSGLLARWADLQKTQLPLLLRAGPCLQSCCLATCWSNPLWTCELNSSESGQDPLADSRVLYFRAQKKKKVQYHNSTQFWKFTVLMATSYGLEDRGVWVRIQTGSDVHPTSYPMCTRDSFPGGKAAGAWSWPLTSN
jgi:hypothetical protein